MIRKMLQNSSCFELKIRNVDSNAANITRTGVRTVNTVVSSRILEYAIEIEWINCKFSPDTVHVLYNNDIDEQYAA